MALSFSPGATRCRRAGEAAAGAATGAADLFIESKEVREGTVQAVLTICQYLNRALRNALEKQDTRRVVVYRKLADEILAGVRIMIDGLLSCGGGGGGAAAGWPDALQGMPADLAYRQEHEAYLAQVAEVADALKDSDMMPNMPPAELKAATRWMALRANMGTYEQAAAQNERQRAMADGANRRKGGGDVVAQLHDQEVQRLAAVRERLEDALRFTRGAEVVDVPLHADAGYLFSYATYKLLKGDIDDFIMSDVEQRYITAVLLQKKFERQGLNEVSAVLRDGIALYNDIDVQLRKVRPDGNLRPGTYGDILKNLRGLQWLLARTFRVYADPLSPEQEAIIERALGKPNLLVEKAEAAALADNAESRRAIRDVGGLVAMTGGAGGDGDGDGDGDSEDGTDGPVHDAGAGAGPATATVGTSMDPPGTAIRGPTVEGGPSSRVTMVDAQTRMAPDAAEAIDARFLTADVQAAVLGLRNKVADLRRDLLRAALKVESAAVPTSGLLGEFMDEVLVKTLKPMSGAWRDHLHLCLTSVSTDDDRALTDLEGQDRQRKVKASQLGAGKAANYMMADAFALYVFKAVRLVAQCVALYVAQKAFAEAYVTRVYSEGRDPPPLRNLLLLALSIDATVQLLALMVALMLSYMFKASSTSFVIDDDLLAAVLGEYFMSTIVLAVLGLAMGNIMYRKRFFAYKDQGLRVTRAYRDGLMAICLLNFLVPYTRML
jgi:hypothetical protein